MNVLFLGCLYDEQTGLYIIRSLGKAGVKRVDAIDIRKYNMDFGIAETQKSLFVELDKLKQEYDIIMILKGLELTYDTIKKLKEKYPKAKLINWFFDKYLVDKPIWEKDEYFETLKLYDYFFCSLEGVAKKLNEYGFDNAYYVDEGCFPPLNGEQYMNNFQRKKYGSDISFIGSIGFIPQHNNRINILKRVVEEGYLMSIWGNVICDWKLIPPILRDVIRKQSVINEKHSFVVQSSKINLGIDQDVNIEQGFSARLFRVLCAGGLYLTTYCKGMEKLFKINKKGEKINDEQELVVYYDIDDLIDKLDFLLEHEKIRIKIGENGKKVVLEKHKFSDRIKEIFEVVKNGK